MKRRERGRCFLFCGRGIVEGVVFFVVLRGVKV
jgi:hypothetical protein